MFTALTTFAAGGKFFTAGEEVDVDSVASIPMDRREALVEAGDGAEQPEYVSATIEHKPAEVGQILSDTGMGLYEVDEPKPAEFGTVVEPEKIVIPDPPSEEELTEGGAVTEAAPADAPTETVAEPAVAADPDVLGENVDVVQPEAGEPLAEAPKWTADSIQMLLVQNVTNILKEVGDDKAYAADVLAAENEQANPRQTLIAPLDAIINS